MKLYVAKTLKDESADPSFVPGEANIYMHLTPEATDTVSLREALEAIHGAAVAWLAQHPAKTETKETA